jgi:SNF2 family DNA or RNA helicase
MPFQRAGIAYASTRLETLIGDEMGLGKTVEVLGLINLDPNIARILVICPASLKINWAREAAKWLVRPHDIQIVNGAPISPSERMITIINYDILKKHKDALLQMSFDLVVLDECHYIKNRKAQRTELVKEIAGRAKRKIFLTGTPLPNRPVEILNVCDVLKPGLFGWAAKVRYCAAYRTKWGWDFSGAAHLDRPAGAPTPAQIRIYLSNIISAGSSVRK